ncbi:tail fiber domain-containing protein [Dokdonella sp.]|uniref:tail fiber domain-containing protein n=1 Tax=Dokdonella sp. TaxID=2291710 RepID=UPI002F3FF502
MAFALMVGVPAHAQQPPNPTPSDSSSNTAGGTDALLNLVLPASNNTAFGYDALYSNVSGQFNTAFGVTALRNSTTGDYNTAVGVSALSINGAGSYNTAVGVLSQYVGSGAGQSNVSVGVESLYSSNGTDNVAIGASALHSNGTAKGNVAVGRNALVSATGDRNIAIGYNAGASLTTGGDNIDIGHPGVAGEAQTIRIGYDPSLRNAQQRTFVTGIYGVSITGGSTVLINASGQLGTVVSSARFKKDVAEMGDASSRLMDLRPVTFHYKADPTQARQYGLIAEEVAKVYPDLVVRNGKGEVDSVAYHELAPMLLNELQKQHREIDALRKERERDVAMLDQMRAMLKEQAAVLTRLQAAPADSVRVAAR